MRRRAVRIFAALLTAAATGMPASLASAGARDFDLVSPVPESAMVSPRTTLLVRTAEPVAPESLREDLFLVRGARSGLHSGAVRLADRNRAVLFVPERSFTGGERVDVALRPGLRTDAGRPLGPLAFSFTIGDCDPAAVTPHPGCEVQKLAGLPPGVVEAPERPHEAGPTGPADLPPYAVTYIGDPSPGCFFVAPFQLGGGGHLLILDNRGTPLFHRRTRFPALDFKRQPDGRLTYFTGAKYYAMDATFTVVDSFQTGNGYRTDNHELQLLPDGHALLMSYDPQPVRMDLVVPGGRPDAIVTGLIVQELDRGKNVIFQWRSWDHFDITDAAIPGGVSLTDSLVDYVHGNSIESDLDGNLLISSRHLEEITKIDRATGQVLWRFGGNAVRNEFRIRDDAEGFSHQHDARRQPDGTITLFDNGNLRGNGESRAVAYRLNESGMHATRVGEWRHDPPIIARAMGSFQQLSSGGGVIGWGLSFREGMTEFDAEGRVAFDLEFQPGFSYRAFKFPWRSAAFHAEPEAVEFGTVAEGGYSVSPVVVTNPGASELVLSFRQTTHPAFTLLSAELLVIPAGESRVVDVRFTPQPGREYDETVYLGGYVGSDWVCQPVRVYGRGDGELQLGEGDGVPPRFLLQEPAPNPFRAATRLSFTLDGAEGVTVRVVSATGRVVRTLSEGMLPAGRHEMTWDGRDEASREAVAGVYFVMLRAGDRVASRRLILLR